ncbi:MAG: membrane integrity-associated transporter subunit PqiC, partial [Methylotenera sp.]|nr:membrane integrity-associated transporter subunit PqiC [Methylotenera sp.]
ASSCSALLPAPAPQPSYYSLDGIPTKSRTPPSTSITLTTVKPTIIITTPRASAGFDTRHMIYMRQAHKLEYFAHSEWVNAPAHMLAPLIMTAIEGSNAFNAVVLSPANVSGDFRLDSEVVRLQQEFDSQPSKVRFTLRVYMVDNATRKVIAMREFDETAIANSDDPYGGVIAANHAVQLVLEKLTAFCSDVFIQNK